MAPQLVLVRMDRATFRRKNKAVAQRCKQMWRFILLYLLQRRSRGVPVDKALLCKAFTSFRRITCGKRFVAFVFDAEISKISLV